MNLKLIKAVSAVGVGVFTIIGALCGLPDQVQAVKNNMNESQTQSNEKASE